MPLTKSSQYSLREILNEAFNPTTNTLEVAAGATAYATSQVSVVTLTTANTAYELAATPLASRRNLMVENPNAGDIYLGTSNAVTTTNGFKLAAGATASLDLGPTAEVWAVTSSAGDTVHVWEFA